MRSFKTLFVAFIAGALAFSCSDNGPEKATIEELSPFARNFLGLKMGSLSSNSMASANGFANAANASFDRIASDANLTFGRLKEDSTGTSPDSVYYPSPWTSCAQLTSIVNKDNSVTTIYDYGDGCLEGNDYFKQLMYGKYSYTYLYEKEQTGSVYKDHYFGNYESNNYGGEYYYDNDTVRWENNGSSEYSGTSVYDTSNHVYSGTYQHAGNDQSTYDGITYSYSGRGKGSYNDKGNIIEMNDYSYSTGDQSYETKVLQPLVALFDCYNLSSESIVYCYIPVYVSGREFVKYRQGSEEGTFIIDYGDGDCDSIVTIIENGKSVELDLYQTRMYY